MTKQANSKERTNAEKEERDRIIMDHLPLVKAIAVRVHENLPVHVDLDDLIHAGILGLFDAVDKFQPAKQVAFSSYAKHRIKGAILDSLRQLDWASRDLRRRHKQVEEATRELAATLQRNPTEAEIAGRMGVEVDAWTNSSAVVVAVAVSLPVTGTMMRTSAVAPTWSGNRPW